MPFGMTSHHRCLHHVRAELLSAHPSIYGSGSPDSSVRMVGAVEGTAARNPCVTTLGFYCVMGMISHPGRTNFAHAALNAFRFPRNDPDQGAGPHC